MMLIEYLVNYTWWYDYICEVWSSSVPMEEVAAAAVEYRFTSYRAALDVWLAISNTVR